jgi:hypothetical protein
MQYILQSHQCPGSAYKFDVAIENLRRYESPGTDHIIAGGKTLRPEIRTLINCIWSREELPGSVRRQSLYLFMRRAIKQTTEIIDFTKLYAVLFPPNLTL